MIIKVDNMGFSVSTTHLIFFIASVVIASVLVGVLSAAVYNIQSGIDARGDTLGENLKTDIEIINDPNNMTQIYSDTDNYNLTIYVKNIGRCQLDRDDVNVIVDGRLFVGGEYNVTAQDENGNWATGAQWNMTRVLRIVILSPQAYATPGSGNHYVKVAINGVDDTLEFRVT